MLQQATELCRDADGRYAQDTELVFFEDYLKTVQARFSLYQKIQKLEPKIIQQVLAHLKAKDPSLLKVGNTDLTAKWQRDTVRTLRYAATALLLDDSNIFKENMLLWFQTIMQSFKVERNCAVTYQVLQKVCRETLTPDEVRLFCPLLEMIEVVLGETSA